MLIDRRGERMVDRCPPGLAVIEVDLLEHRRIDDPDEFPGVVVDQAAPLPHLQAHCGQQAECVRSLACGEEDAVTGLRAGMRGEAGALLLGQVLGDRSAQLAVLTDQHIGEPTGAARAGPVLPRVEHLAWL